MSKLFGRFTGGGDDRRRDLHVNHTIDHPIDHPHASWSGNDRERSEGVKANRSISQTISFSDFSMHVMDDAHDDVIASVGVNPTLKPVATKPVAIPSNHESRVTTSVEEELSNLRIHTKTTSRAHSQPLSPVSKSLGIPSVASIFGTPKAALGISVNDRETPRSSLDLYDASDSTLSSTPTPKRVSADGTGSESVPVTPRSPKGQGHSPGGSRRRNRINGLDSFEWLELVRGSSL